MKRQMEVKSTLLKIYLQTFWYKYICCMSPILFFIIFFTCTGVGKIFLQINPAAVAFINILIAAWEGLNVHFEMYCNYIEGKNAPVMDQKWEWAWICLKQYPRPVIIIYDKLITIIQNG